MFSNVIGRILKQLYEAFCVIAGFGRTTEFPYDVPPRERSLLPVGGFLELRIKQKADFSSLDIGHLVFPLEDVKVFECHTVTPDATDKHPKRPNTAPIQGRPDNEKGKSKVHFIVPAVAIPIQFHQTKCSNALHTT